jgi:glutathione peroxidase
MKWTTAITILVLAAAGAQAGDKPQETAAQAKTEAKMTETTIDYRNVEFLTIDGAKTNLNAFKGKLALLVNVASQCGYTPQYKGLEELYRKYKDQGVVVIGFPANNFGAQEPGTNAEIKTFCTTNFGVSFPMMSKVSVKGGDIHPLFAYLTQQSPQPGEIQWNFSKFLLDQEGKLVARWGSKTEPMSADIVGKIESLLKAEKAKS